MCAVAATAMHGCTVDGEPEHSDVAAAAAICSTRSAGDPWWHATFPQQTERFHVLVRATPQDGSIDAVIGVSQGVASTWSQLAAIVRFAPTGVIDVRDGGVYRADVAYPYAADIPYEFRIEIDVQEHRYSVFVRTPGGSYQAIARDYAFRTEQAGVTALDAAAVYLDTTADGALEICDLDAIRDDTTPDGCLTATTDGGFANAWVPPVQGAMVAQFSVTPSEVGIDGVIGYSGGTADSFDDLVAAVRFWTDGQIQARDGTTYRASNEMRYVAGGTYQFYVVLDFVSARYSVYAAEGFAPASYTLIADNFAFRPSQIGVPLINNLVTVVDGGAGQVKACAFATTSGPELQHVRTGNYVIAPFRDGRAVISDGARTQVVDNAGRVLAEAALPASHITVAASGDVYIATLDPGTTTLTLTAVTSELRPRWTQSYSVRGGVHAMGVYDNGDVALALGAPALTVAEVLTVHPDGAEVARVDLSQLAPHAVGIGRDRFAVGYAATGGVIVEARAIDGEPIWQRTWPGTASVYRIAVEPSGSVVFGGTFGGTGIDFGAGHYEPHYAEVALNGYIVALSAQGDLRYANRLYADGPSSLVSSGDIIAYATTRWSQIPHPQLWIYDRDGTVHHADYLGLVGDSAGSLGDVIVDGDGRVIANARLKLHPSNQVPTWPVLASFVF